MDKKELRQSIKQASSFDDIYRVLSSTEFDALRSSEVELISRELANSSEKSDIKIAYLSNYTIEPLPSYVTTRSAFERISVSDYLGAYDQYYQEVLTPHGGLKEFSPKVIILSLTLRRLAPRVYFEFGSLSADEVIGELGKIITHLKDWAEAARHHTNANILICNFPRPSRKQLGIADLKSLFGETKFYLELNLKLLELFKSDARVHVVDIDGLVSRYGSDNVYNPKMRYLAKMEWTEGFLPYIAEELVRYLKALMGRTRKCLVLDLDNTLWGGVVGEDGVSGIRIGDGDPEGEAYRDFQYAILALKKRGIILAINSKNNKVDVDEVFIKRTEMPLKIEDFSVARINWNNKHENILEIAETLNIGTDSIVFADDNPVECALIEEMNPEVKVIALSKDPIDFIGLLGKITDFEKIQITREDQVKIEQYAQNALRTREQKSIGSLDGYLDSLGTQINLRSPGKDDMVRVHQLFSKTNQFNVTTKRYGLPEIEKFVVGDNYVIRIVDVKDRFGNLGSVGLYLLRLDGSGVNIDSFILSCRAMGRGIETAIMNQLKQDYLQNKVAGKLEACYVPTIKNKPAEDFFELQGFSISSVDDSGVKYYEYDVSNMKKFPCEHITVHIEEER